MNMKERIAEVSATIDQLTQLVPAKSLSYSPEALKDLTIEEFKELITIEPSFDPWTSYNNYYAYGRIKGAMVRADTAEGTRKTGGGAKAELFGA